jgi:hypothetical protein
MLQEDRKKTVSGLTLGCVVFFYSEHTFFTGQHYVYFLLATIASHVDSIGNCMVEDVYSLFPLTYDCDFQ